VERILQESVRENSSTTLLENNDLQFFGCFSISYLCLMLGFETSPSTWSLAPSPYWQEHDRDGMAWPGSVWRHFFHSQMKLGIMFRMIIITSGET